MDEGDSGDISRVELDRLFDEAFGGTRVQERIRAEKKNERRLLLLIGGTFLVIVLVASFGDSINIFFGQ